MSRASHWIDGDFFDGERGEDDVNLICRSCSDGQPKSHAAPDTLLAIVNGNSTDFLTVHEVADRRTLLSREVVAGHSHPVQFDDMFSIDKRGNTLHFVDDHGSVAKASFPVRRLWLAVAQSFRSALQLVHQLAMSPLGINVAQT